MRNILLVSQNAELPAGLPSDAEIRTASNTEDALSVMRDNQAVTTLLIEHPSELPEIRRLIAKMQETAGSYAIKDVTLSVSLGYCTMEDAGESIADSIKRSDADMYRDKLRKKAARV